MMSCSTEYGFSVERRGSSESCRAIRTQQRTSLQFLSYKNSILERKTLVSINKEGRLAEKEILVFPI